MCALADAAALLRLETIDARVLVMQERVRAVRERVRAVVARTRRGCGLQGGERWDLCAALDRAAALCSPPEPL